MGWYGTYGATKGSLIQEIVAPYPVMEPAGTRYTTHRRTCGNVLWTVEEVRDSAGKVLEKAIGCYLLRKGKGDWAYKAMSEMAEPYYFDCPLQFLDLVPELRPEWRKLVREHHAAQAAQKAKAASLAIGQKWSLVGARGLTYVVIGRVQPTISGQCDNGRLYRIPAKMLGELLDERAIPYAAEG